MGVEFKGEVQAGNVAMSALGILVIFETTGPEEITLTVAGYRRILISSGKLPMFRDWGDEDETARKQKSDSQ